jgi:AcrR family transcriptional regulator
VARPRDPDLDDDILAAATALVAAGGFGALTIEAVAARAGVGRPTVYRRWPSRAHLALAVARRHLAAGPHDRRVPDTGSLRGDVRALVDDLVDDLDRLRAAGLLHGIVAAVAADADLAAVVRHEQLDPTEARLAEVLDRAVDRGEARRDRDATALRLLAGAAVYQLALLREPADDAWRDRLTAVFVDGVAARP